MTLCRIGLLQPMSDPSVQTARACACTAVRDRQDQLLNAHLHCQSMGRLGMFASFQRMGDAKPLQALYNTDSAMLPLQDELSGADIKAMCTEAGLLALRERRMRVTHTDFKKAKEKVLYKKKEGVPEGLYL